MALLQKVISGGQTGADRAALDWAIEHGIPHGGWCPKGRRAEDGPIDVGVDYQERERVLRSVGTTIDGHATLNLDFRYRHSFDAPAGFWQRQ